MPTVRFAYADPRVTGVDAPAVGRLFLALAQPEQVGGVLRTVRAFEAALVDGVASVPLTPGVWYVTTEGVAGENERWIRVPVGTSTVNAVDLEDVDPLTLEPVTPGSSLFDSVTAIVAEYMADHPSASPEQIGEAVAAYLAANPPTSGDVTLEAHPTFVGAAILTVGDYVAPPAGVAPLVTVHPVGTSKLQSEPFTLAADATGTPAPAVQWQFSVDGVAWADIVNDARVSGATTKTLAVNSSIAASIPGGYGLYRARFTNATGSASSNTATVDVAAD